LASIALSILAKTPLILIGLPILFALQIIRIARESGQSGRMRWIGAQMLLLAKLPEALGAIRYFVAGKGHTVPEYKAHA